MLFTIALFIAGLVLLYLGAGWLIKGSVGLSLRFGVSKLAISLTVVAFGTSTPELVVTVLAALRGSPDIAMGNIIGSNIANIGLILGVSATVMPLLVQVSTIRRELPIAIGASIVLLALCWQPSIGMLEGGVLVGGLVGYVWFTYSSSRKESPALPPDVAGEYDTGITSTTRSTWTAIAWAIAGLALLSAGAELLVRSATAIAREADLSEKIIGLTIVAVGTSLPELATSVVAAARKEADIAVGNVVGSNVFNILGIGGAAALLQPLHGMERFIVDMLIMIAFSLLLLGMVRSGFRISRMEGGVLLAGYVGYILWLGFGA
jgi:cation:H+ antiporter